jgi:LysM repeat protein
MVTTSRFVRALGGVAAGGVLLSACSLGGGSSTTSTSTTLNTAQTTFRTIPFTPSTTTTLPAGATPAGSTTTAVAGSTEGVYTVKAGDAWLLIARKLGVDAAELAQFNGKALTDPLQPGDQLKIPPKSTSSTVAGTGSTTATTAKPAGSTTTTTSPIKVAGSYTVVAGDYWVGIAKKLGVDYKELLAVNGATAQTALQPGQKIKVPAKSAGTTTTVKGATTTTAKP